MFTLKTKDKRVVMFHINDLKPSTIYFDEIQYISADGDELELVRSQFENLPITKGNHCTWTGELARLVFRNIILTKMKDWERETNKLK